MCIPSTFVKSKYLNPEAQTSKFPHGTFASRKESLGKLKRKMDFENWFIKRILKVINKKPGFAPFTVAMGPSEKWNESYNK